MSDRNKFSLQWNSHLSGTEAEAFKEMVLNSSPILGRLKNIIKDILLSIESDETSIQNYEQGWDYRQAFLNGRKAALKEIDRLL